MESLGQGTAFLRASAVWGGPPLGALPPDRVPYAVAVGVMAGAHGVGEDAACTGFLPAFAANLASVAVRLVPLGQTAGLRVFAELDLRC